jgi:hydrogenase-4 membrane subunit HyfE
MGRNLMRLPLILFLLAAVIPVFFGKIRSAPFWLSLQAIALGWNGVAHSDGMSGHALVALLDVIAVRAVVAPLLLRRAIHLRGDPNLDLMPSNLFAWVIGIALIVLAFEFGGAATTDVGALALGVVGAMVAIALLLLSTNDALPAQLVAVLFMENGIAVFESLLPEPWPLPVHGALTVVYLVTVGVGSWLIGTPAAAATSESSVPGETP